MDFYTIVLIIAVVLLILALTGLSLMLTQVGTTTSFPPISNTCPDGWTAGSPDVSGNITCTSNGKNVPTANYSSGTTTTKYPVGNKDSGKNSTGYINYFYSSEKFLGGVTATQTAADQVPSLMINKGIVKNVCDQKTWADANKIIWDGVTNSNAKC